MVNNLLKRRPETRPNRKMNRTPWLPVCVLVTLCSAVAAAFGAVDIPDFAAQLGGPHWFIVSLRGQRTGYLKWNAHVHDTPDGQRLEIREHVRIFFSVNARSLQIQSTHIAFYDENLQPTRIEFSQNQMGRVTETTVDITDTELEVTIRDPSGTHTETIPRPDTLGSELMVFQDALEGNITEGWTREFTTFDPFVNHLDTFQGTYVGTEEAECGELIRVEFVTDELNVTSQVWLDSNGMMYRQKMPALLGAEFVRSTRDEALGEITGTSFNNTIPTGTPGEDPHRADEVRLQVSTVAGSVGDIIPDTPLQNIEETDDGARVTVRPQQPPTHTVSIPVTGEEFSEYLQANEIAQCEAEEIRALAREIVGDETDAWVCAKKLLDWIHRNLRQVESEPRPVSALEILQEGRGDCSEHAILFSALAQSIGIPTKLVLGLVYMDSGYAYHAWNEVYVGQWVQMDPSWKLYTRGAGHLQIASGPVSREAMIKNNIATARTIGTLFVEFLPRQSDR